MTFLVILKEVKRFSILSLIRQYNFVVKCREIVKLKIIINILRLTFYNNIGLKALWHIFVIRSINILDSNFFDKIDFGFGFLFLVQLPLKEQPELELEHHDVSLVNHVSERKSVSVDTGGGHRSIDVVGLYQHHILHIHH